MVIRRTVVCVALCALALSACAKRPNAIAPVTIPANAYSNLSCDELTEELTKERATLVALSKKQNQAATADAVGVLLVGVPAASLTGNDNEGDLAVSKGKVLSLESTIKGKGR